MIVTVTLNPALDLTYSVDALVPHGVHRVAAAAERAGGKGVNVARVLHAIGEPVLATGLLGGATGGRVAELLAAEGVPASFTAIAGDTRRTVAVADQRDATGFWEPGPRISAVEWSLMLTRYRELLKTASVVALCGSLPPGVPMDGYAEMVRLAAAAGVPTVLDTSGEPLRLGLAAGPTLAKPNATELATLLDPPAANRGTAAPATAASAAPAANLATAATTAPASPSGAGHPPTAETATTAATARPAAAPTTAPAAANPATTSAASRATEATAATGATTAPVGNPAAGNPAAGNPATAASAPTAANPASVRSASAATAANRAAADDAATADGSTTRPAAVPAAAWSPGPAAALLDGLSISDLAEAVHAVAPGAGAVVVSRGPLGLVAVTRDGVWAGRPPVPVKGNPTGAGDAVVAALTRGLRDRTPWPALLAEAVALSAAAVAAPIAGAFDVGVYRRILPLVTVTEHPRRSPC
jgi:tagatose 6-phosphate kinase